LVKAVGAEGILLRNGTFMNRKTFYSAVVFFGLIFLLSGCGFWSKKQPEPTPQTLYNNALTLYGKKKFERAADAFRKFKEEFPLSDLTPLVELRLADCLFYDKKYAEAFIQYEEFKKLHPIHAEIPYATYQMAMCHFKQITTIDRDQAETAKASELFRFVVENYPQSKYAEAAKGRIQYCQRQMADHEFYIGNFYFKQKNYRAALSRFEGILTKYPDSGLEAKLKPLIETCRKEISKAEKNRRS